MDRILARCLPPLRRWAHGRLPAMARGLHDTGDLVQDTVVSALARLDRFEARGEGALQAYFRQAIIHRITDVMRARQRRPAQVEADSHLPDAGASPLDLAIGAENLRRYDAALARLRDDDREAIIMRLELQYDYAQMAEALGRPSANAARVAVTRALHRLAEVMRDEARS